jgi:hypothetical protein
MTSKWAWLSITLSLEAGCARRAPPSGAATAPPEAPAKDAGTLAPENAEEQRDRTCTANVEAPLADVRRILVDYEHYASTLPRFGKSRVLRRSAGQADVYLQVPILKGAGNLWAVARFVGPTSKGNAETIEGKYLGEGNVSTFHCLWTYRSLDERRTSVELGLLLLPQFPLPESIVDDELDSACRDALEGVKAHAEAKR